ncbi:5'-phosphate synthase pdxT subunit [Natranaerovirga hydrolytica]|uniref:Pyridoxal 5'-phosphate synthase subunit PdxT n=1 Tax=Natranaerovirga hydrolytica TaxID=680378 RepID=A0A4R1MPL1_9FIRM|nr:pyridoxal 5'-phosphate synthase glutaminase subunit PdxT [Natranaerovirga hydrolytica]TCK93244.1 5'-phosphate synthase pdxT subunit [Natranaerovirga hydrolytica]
MLNVGVLDLQGSVKEHLNSLSKIKNVEAIKVKYKDDLESINGLIIPGGESTTMGKLLDDFNIKSLLKERIANGLPVWGTCAGMILLAKNIHNQEDTHLATMDITVKRNAYGRQINSFMTYELIPEISNKKIPLVFIRAPYILETSSTVEIIATINNNIVAAKQNNMFVTSFHPELTDDIQVHQYFIETFVKTAVC